VLGTGTAYRVSAKFPGFGYHGVTVGSVLQPNGPLPAAVYWRRRAVALAGLLAALLLLIWLVAAAVGGGPEQAVQPAAQQSQPAEAPPETAETAESVTPSSDASAVTSETTSAPQSTAEPPASAPPPAPAEPPAPPAPPAPPQPCPDEVTAVAAQPERPEYVVGSKPVFELTVTNTGAVPCVRDLDAGLQELLVFAADGTTRLWSSNDCYPGDSIDVRTLQPGETIGYSVTWAGRSSRPQCAGQRVQVPAGDYFVVAKLGPLTSAPVPFRLTR